MRWLLLTGGWIVWAAHFLAVYAAGSVFDLMGGAEQAASRLTIGAVTLFAVGVNIWLILLVGRPGGPGVSDEDDPGLRRLWRTVAGGGAALSIAAVLWQGLPAALL
jgi:hypothetical protein